MHLRNVTASSGLRIALVHTTPVDAAKYDKMSASNSNAAMGTVASEISQTAIAPGKIVQTNSPTWL
ncbi:MULTISPECIES: hypothetical protein [unclassified Mesorhizobium]|uniref:hypothetical protein n=1 Tax=unclassified Mesorhizobium TaxID=325217 RepID=UPI000FD44EB6|nr:MULTISPECIES: hypothetical protein [unclassified Mesorhizobium]RVB75027.1 hypothetical protein EN885_20400 [Mesorhizobium sp. M6A.T.Cr.TU.014.01.1.1]RWP72143.1 MAG: hypothetical protein EOR10_28185 [Mesorhizobium sp.]RWQ04833.1 MAG: hypothetical protein EOR91_16370 [Mesorhizobium sp.]RWQ11604.1 MAG: hypothetical protein EOR90_01225 [Mesorhizobium sp.]